MANGSGLPLNSIFANQFKCKIRKKLRVFVLNVAISGPNLPLVGRNTKKIILFAFQTKMK